MRKVNVLATYQYEVEIDDSNEIVQDYESENQLLLDAANYRFSEVLPVINTGGLKVKDITLIELE